MLSTKGCAGFLTSTVLSICLSQNIFAETVNIKFQYEDVEVLPYFFGEGKTIPTERPGVTIEALRLLDEALPEVSISYQREPWKRCLLNLEKGRADAVVASYKPERTTIGRYPGTHSNIDADRGLYRESYCLFKNSTSDAGWDGKHFFNLEGQQVAAPLGYSIVSVLKQHHLRVKEVESTGFAVKLLANQRVGGLVSLCRTVEHVIKKNGWDTGKIKMVQPPITEKMYYLMLSRQFVEKHPDLSEKIWDMISVIGKEKYPGLLMNYSEN